MKPKIDQTIQETVNHKKDANGNNDNVPNVEKPDSSWNLPRIVHKVFSVKKLIVKKIINKYKKKK